jgi:hypothetical protein
LTEKKTTFFKEKSKSNLKELERAFRDIYSENEANGEIFTVNHIKIQRGDLKTYLNKRYPKRVADIFLSLIFDITYNSKMNFMEYCQQV